MTESCINNKKIIPNNLIKYGFVETKGSYILRTSINKGDFSLCVEIRPPNFIKTTLIEIDTKEIYTLHLTNAQGKFVGKIREEFNSILNDIVSKCFENNIFKLEYSCKVIDYIKETYGDSLEYLWEKFPDNAVARRKDNSKWYLAILTVKKDRLGLMNSEPTEIIDLRAEPEQIPELIKQNNIFPGYHMNKKNWISIILDGSMDIKEIFRRIDISYKIAGMKK